MSAILLCATSAFAISLASRDVATEEATKVPVIGFYGQFSISTRQSRPFGHSWNGPDDRGDAVIDIFRVDNGSTVKHWDVIQRLLAKAANDDTMFWL